MKKQLQEIFFPSLKRAIIVLLFMGISEQLYFLRYPVLATVFNFSGSMSFVCVVAFVLISEFRRKANQKIIFFKALGEIFFQLGLMVLVFSLILGIGSNTDLQIYVIVFFFGAASLVVGKYYEKEYSDSPQNHAHKK